MLSSSAILTTAGWLAIITGSAMALLGFVLFGEIFAGRDIPVGAAGPFVLITLGAGPLLALSGIAIVTSGIKLMGGHTWARSVLEVFSWIALCVSIGWLIYSATQLRHIHFVHVFRGALFFLFTGGPSIILLLLLRSDAMHRALTR